ncbi:MAG: hypothetical protein KIG36_05310 [Eubacteriales bacterium]|nr:hypothetical protein [Eubacteriales bacterium]
MFSNIIKKANLSADKQAVREMNMALAEYTAAHNYVKPQDVETVMKILGELGYNSYNWACLTTGYSVYYDKQENQMVLYSAKSASIEYPEGYEGVNVFVAENKTDERFAEYNNNVNRALSIDYSFSSSTASQSGTTLVSTKETDDSAKVISSALSGAEGAKIANTIGIDSVGVYVNASTFNRSSTYDALNPSTSTYAEIAAYHLSNQETIVLENNGELKANTFVVSVNIAENATAQQIKEAQVAAGDFVYSVFVQKNIGMLEEEVAVILPAGSTIDVSSHEWQAAKQFSGYFGTDDPDHPVVIKGLRLTDATSYALTYQLQGSSSRYNITGFIGAIYGDSIVENLVFEDITLDSPGKDYIIAEGQNNRNTVAIIGGIIPDR